MTQEDFAVLDGTAYVNETSATLRDARRSTMTRWRLVVEFSHSSVIRQSFPNLLAFVAVVDGVEKLIPDEAKKTLLERGVSARLDAAMESEMPEIYAWREAFTKMGLKATQYRCASESLLRRYRKERSLPSFHPLVDYLNLVSMRHAIPIAAFDVSRIADRLIVQPADGSETYLSFQGEREAPAPGEVIFKDANGNAHSRRWTFRQSALSVISASSRRALVVAEALHQAAAQDLDLLGADVSEGLTKAGATMIAARRLGPADRGLTF